MRKDDRDPRTDPFAPENLPKGMKLKQPMRLSQADRNYVADVVKALKSVEDLEIDVLKLDVSEDVEQNSMMSLLLEIKPKGGDAV